jgi:hypothetical protein
MVKKGKKANEGEKRGKRGNEREKGGKWEKGRNEVEGKGGKVKKGLKGSPHFAFTSGWCWVWIRFGG